MQRSRRGVPAKEKLEAKAQKVPSIEPASTQRKRIVGSNDGSGEKFEGGLGGNVGSCGGNAGRGGSIARRGGGSLAKCSMKSKNGLGGGAFVILRGRSSSVSKEECLDGWVRADRGELKGGGVDFREMKILRTRVELERKTPLDLLGNMKRQHALRHAPSILPRATSTITAKTSLNTKESDRYDEEDYEIQRNSFGAPVYGPKPAKYLNCHDSLDRSIALQEVLNPFRKICVWKKAVSFLESLPVALQHED
uniref:Uncharacterized protein n=1 Tax=Tanacetum cinerariifolium TaxID=118510 RepID=A0A699GWK2_TANCI|nr:hypothetical protein [Tanacetum cinerariifolium]